MDGILVIDKPQGPTSHDVVLAARKALHEARIGHTGTLDPNATGVLPLVLGKATKISRFLTGGTKRYDATFKLGVVTDTRDAAGQVVSEAPVAVTRAQVEVALLPFLGAVQQLPPMFSAKKQQGTRLYTLARQGIEVERESKAVHIFAMNLTAFEGNLVSVTVHCSAGTYVRVIAHDLGQALGCGAHLSALRRTHAGPFSLEQTITLQKLVEAPEEAALSLIGLERAFEGLAQVSVPKSLARMITQGYQLCAADVRNLTTQEFAADDLVRLCLEQSGALVALARCLVAHADMESVRRDERVMKTEKVFDHW